MALAFTPSAILMIYDKCTCIPYFWTFLCCTLGSKNCCSRAKAGAGVCKSPPLPYWESPGPFCPWCCLGDLPPQFWLMLYYFPFSLVVLLLHTCSYCRGCHSHRLESRLWLQGQNFDQIFLAFWLLTTLIFGALTTDCIEFQPLTVDYTHIDRSIEKNA